MFAHFSYWRSPNIIYFTNKIYIAIEILWNSCSLIVLLTQSSDRLCFSLLSASILTKNAKITQSYRDYRLFVHCTHTPCTNYRAPISLNFKNRQALCLCDFYSYNMSFERKNPKEFAEFGAFDERKITYEIT